MSSNEIPSDYHLLFHDIKSGRAVTKKSQFKSRVGYVLYEKNYENFKISKKFKKILTYTHKTNNHTISHTG